MLCLKTIMLFSKRMRALCAALCVTIVLASVAQALASQPHQTLQAMATLEISAYRREKTRAVLAMQAVDVRTGKTLISIRKDELLIPASNQKILSAAFVLARFGADHKLKTKLALTEDMDVVVMGGFDPMLGDPVYCKQKKRSVYAELDKWVKQLKILAAGRVVRNILVEVTPGRPGFRHPDWPQRQNHTHYQAPVAKANFHNNSYGVFFKVAGGRVKARIRPYSRLVKYRSSLKVGKKHLWDLRPSDDDSQVRLRGTVKGSTPNSPMYVAANNPPMLLGRTLADRMRRAGVEFAGRVDVIASDKIARERLQIVSATETPLADAIGRANRDSLNMAAESLMLAAGDGTWAGSARIMSDTLTKEYALAPGSLVVSDGSGLSRKNRVTPAAMATILRALARRADAEVFVGSLSVCGVDGTLKNRMRSKRYRGRVAAKTGYILHVSCLSGYVLDKSGKPAIAFSIMANRIRGRVAGAKRMQERICRAMVDAIDR